ncbi:MAG TPA: thiamine pyrophosphate-dependent enzyme [Methanocella sp.]|nr:thiamine pyrophosphate-dependent enzyme [Methanocella sp.]
MSQLAELLAGQGLAWAFGITGSGSSIDLIAGLEARGVRYYPACHEAAAAIMAGAACKVSGQLAASISIKGPGIANMLPGIAVNAFENAPALSISEAYGSNVPAFKMHKRLDHAAILSSVVKARATLDGIGEALPELIAASRAEAPGPVHLDLCDSGRAWKAPVSRAEKPDPRSDKRALKLISEARRPAVIAGSLALRRGWGSMLERVEVPVFYTAAAKGVIDDGLTHCAGIYTGDGKSLAPESVIIGKSDLVLGLGLRNTEILSSKAFGRPTVIVDDIVDDFADQERLSAGMSPDVLVAGAGDAFVTTLLEAVSVKSWGSEATRDTIIGVRAELLNGKWLPAACFDELNKLEYDHALVTDTGAFCTIAEHLWKAGGSRPYISSGNGRYMGTSIPMAVGTSIARPGTPVFCAAGEGGVSMYPSEIKLAIDEKLPICFLFMSDGRYGSVGGAPGSAPSRNAVTIRRPSWWKAVEAMGCESFRANSIAEFAGHIDSWMRQRPLFIESIFDPAPYAAMTAGLR